MIDILRAVYPSAEQFDIVIEGVRSQNRHIIRSRIMFTAVETRRSFKMSILIILAIFTCEIKNILEV